MTEDKKEKIYLVEPKSKQSFEMWFEMGGGGVRSSKWFWEPLWLVSQFNMGFKLVTTQHIFLLFHIVPLLLLVVGLFPTENAFTSIKHNVIYLAKG